jgi:hypothetical protein
VKQHSGCGEATNDRKELLCGIRKGNDVRSLRQRVSDRLLRAGSAMAFDRQHMNAQIAADPRSRTIGPRDVEELNRYLSTLDLLSRILVRVGLLLMPPPRSTPMPAARR